MAYYVDSEAANDNGVGSVGDPWQLLGAHVNGVSPGDTIYIVGDVGSARVYDEGEIDITVDGSDGSPITIMPAPGTQVEWQHDGVQIWDCTGDWLVIWGLTFNADSPQTTGAGGANGDKCLRIDGTDCRLMYCTLKNGGNWTLLDLGAAHRTEVGYCTFLNNFAGDASDAHGIWSIDAIDDLWVHHCTCTGTKGDFVQLEMDEVYGSGHIFEYNDIWVTAGQERCCEGAFDMKQGSGIIRYNNIWNFWGTGDGDEQTCGGSGSNGEAIFIHDTGIGHWYIYGNVIHDCTIGIWVQSGGTADVYNNTFYNMRDVDAQCAALGGHGAAIYVADGPTEMNVWNNVFYNCLGRSVLTSTSILEVRNNIFMGCGDFTGGTSTTSDHNCWYDCDSSDSGAGDVTDDPEFTNVGSYIFTLTSGSPCIDAGVDVGLDYLGDLPDMGAFEYEASEVTGPLPMFRSSRS